MDTLYLISMNFRPLFVPFPTALTLYLFWQ